MSESQTLLPRPPPYFERGIFTLNDLQWIGFDLDHTLARYRHGPTSLLIFGSLAKFLVRHCGYPASVQEFRYDPTFITKGVVCDNLHGNFFAVDHLKTISGARYFHGTREFIFDNHNFEDVAPEIISPHIYPGPISEFDPMATDTPGKSDRYHSFITYFDMPAGYLYALLIDLKDQLAQMDDMTQEQVKPHLPLTPGQIDVLERDEAQVNQHWYKHEQDGNRNLLKPDQAAESSPEEQLAALRNWARKSYADIWKDLIRGFHHNFGDCNRGYYFPAFFRSPGRFIYRRPDLKAWLVRLRQLFGKKLLLVTNSRHAYAHCLLQYMFETPHWHQYFDLSVVWARKPQFWTGLHPFVPVTIYQDLSPESILLSKRSFNELCPSPDGTEAECFYFPEMGCDLNSTVDKIELPDDPTKPGPTVGIGNYSVLQRLFFPDCPAVKCRPEDLASQLPWAASHISSEETEDISSGIFPARRNADEEEAQPESKSDDISCRVGVDGGVKYLKQSHRCGAIYFGDNLRTDVMAISLYTTWLAGGILEEAHEVWPEDLEHVLVDADVVAPVAPHDQEDPERLLPILDHGCHFQNSMPNTPSCMRSGALQQLGKLSDSHVWEPVAEYEPVCVNPTWGSFFLAGSNNPRDSYWHNFVSRHSNVVVADVTDFIGGRLSQEDGMSLPDNMDVPLRYSQPEDVCYWSPQEQLVGPPGARHRRSSLAQAKALSALVRKRMYVWSPPNGNNAGLPKSDA